MTFSLMAFMLSISKHKSATSFIAANYISYRISSISTRTSISTYPRLNPAWKSLMIEIDGSDDCRVGKKRLFDAAFKLNVVVYHGDCYCSLV